LNLFRLLDDYRKHKVIDERAAGKAFGDMNGWWWREVIQPRSQGLGPDWQPHVSRKEWLLKYSTAQPPAAPQPLAPPVHAPDPLKLVNRIRQELEATTNNFRMAIEQLEARVEALEAPNKPAS
jgi:hypothetical protein